MSRFATAAVVTIVSFGGIEGRGGRLARIFLLRFSCLVNHSRFDERLLFFFFLSAVARGYDGGVGNLSGATHTLFVVVVDVVVGMML